MIHSRVTPAAAAITAMAQLGGTDVAGSTGTGNTVLDELPAQMTGVDACRSALNLDDLSHYISFSGPEPFV